MDKNGSKRSLAAGLAVLFLMLLLAGLGVRFWASGQIIRTGGPTHVATDGEQVLLFVAGSLLQLSADGALQAEFPIAQTGLQDDPIDLRFTRDGRLLVATQRPAAVRLCDLATWACQPVAEAAAGRVERQFKILEGGGAQEWLLTDARGDTLWRLSPQNLPQAVVPTATLAGPNALAFARDGALWVADTDHRRVVELVPDGAGSFVSAREHSAVNEHTVGRAWFPMMLAPKADGRWWVTQAAEFSQDQAELMVYDPDEGAQARIALPPGAYPTDLAATANAVLVTDMERYAVYRVAGDTLEVSLFGDDRLLGHFDQLRQQRKRYEQLSRGSLVVMIVCGALMLGAAVLATPREKRWTRVSPLFDPDKVPAEAPPVSGIHWLRTNPAFERSLWWAERVGYLLVALPVLGLLVLYAVMRAQAGDGADAQVQGNLDETLVALAVCSLLTLLLVPLIRHSLRALRMRLGTDGRRLYIRRPDGRQFAVEPSQLAYTDRMILYREYNLPLVGGKREPVYAPGEVETWLAPLLRQAPRLGPAAALKHQWRHRRGGAAWWAIGVMVLLVGLIIAALVVSGNTTP